MDSKQFHRREWGIVAMVVLVFAIMVTTLYDLQINSGAEFRRQSQFKIAETEMVEATRGQILDRNGKVLVSDRAVYQVTLNTKLMEKDRNGTILSLVQVSRELQVQWTDTLPISKTAPFTFTTDTPYFTVTKNEDGSETKKLTRLGALCVRKKWIQDPTLEALPVEEGVTEQVSFLQKVKNIFKGKKVVAPTEKEEEPYRLPTAEELLGLMCASFEVKGEGAIDPKTAGEGAVIPSLNIGDMNPADARDVVGILYEVTLRSLDIYRVPYTFAEEVDIEFISRVKERSLNGVVVEPRTIREYHTTYAAHILGRVGPIFAEEWEKYKAIDNDGDGQSDYKMDDTVGKDGIEAAFESYLRGTPGKRAVERNTNGKVVYSDWLQEPQPGNNVILTLDLDLQSSVENILATAIPRLASRETKGAACVVLDVNNSDVLASASYPTFNLNTFSADYKALSEDPLSPLLNRALMGLYPPGSTFKMVTGIAGLEENIVTPATKILDEGRYTYYQGTAPQCWIYRQHKSTHGYENVSEAIRDSCNYYFFDVGRKLGIELLDDYAARFGLGQKTGLELYEASGVMAGPAFTESLGGTWYPGNTLSVAIGQESSQFTPIQLANYIATLVNGGTRNATHLLKQVKSSDFTRTVYNYEPEVLSTIDIKPQNLAAVKAGMLMLTTEGSVAKYFQQLGVQVGAKTGSAQVSSQTESNAVFVCFAPYEKPEVAVAIVVEHGGSGSELGAIAAQVLGSYFTAKVNTDTHIDENTLIR